MQDRSLQRLLREPIYSAKTLDHLPCGASADCDLGLRAPKFVVFAAYRAEVFSAWMPKQGTLIVSILEKSMPRRYLNGLVTELLDMQLQAQ